MSSISSLIGHFELEEESLNLQVSDRHLDEIARSSCRQWKSLLTRLGVPRIVVDDIDARQVGEDKKRRSCFFEWKAQQGSRATYRRLVEGLLEINCQEDAESVCKILEEESDSNMHIEQPISVTIPLLPHEKSEDNIFANTMVDFSTIDDIMGYLHDYADKWEAIGIGLNFQPDELNNIKRIVTLTTPQQRLRELLYQWIQRDTTTSQVPTMGSLHHTLSSDQVGLGNVAFNIKNDMAFNMENNSQESRLHDWKAEVDWKKTIKIGIHIVYHLIAGIAIVYAHMNSYKMRWLFIHGIISYLLTRWWAPKCTFGVCLGMNCLIYIYLHY